MEKPLWYRWAKVPFVGTLIIGTGVVLYNTIIPTDEDLIKLFSPEIRANYERNKALRQKEQEELMRIVQETAKSNDPIWKTGPIVSPWDKETKGKVTQLVNTKTFYQEIEDEKRKKEIDQAKEQFLETEQLVAQSKKSWWKFW
ncbi:hypothetical protein PUMCH_004443 [Australozyma saopauloensis]|uniref:Cytochrome b mRNA-processing protein 4 n=1 Tax=Australozyma saopauloensis TaxID=291208 RepID=A0AAX4HEW9_9ASCO|nr:hypothetical protein PUMCH_004443 [[Candida] saopauloensis]